MRPLGLLVRGAIGFALVLGFIVSAMVSPANAATSYARITLHVNECPADTADVFGDCHQNRVEGVTFYIAGSAKVTSANGIATGAPSAGYHLVAMDFAQYMAGKYAGSWVYCSDQVTGSVLRDGPADEWIRLTTVNNHLTICDWYLLT